MNTFKTMVLMTGLTLLLLLIGRMLGGPTGMIMAFIIALVMNGVSFWFSDRIVLRMYGAKKAVPDEAPLLYETVSKLSREANLPMPKVYLIPAASPNAFATGRDPEHAAVAVTQGILRTLNREELEGVISHELAHIRNKDILIGSMVATIVGAISLLAYMARFAAIFGGGRGTSRDRGNTFGLLAMAILAPIMALLIQMAISRSREYEADSSGAKISGNPRGLASALRKLHQASRNIPLKSNPASSHIFIVSPLRGTGFLKLFSTHPPMEERIKRLQALS